MLQKRPAAHFVTPGLHVAAVIAEQAPGAFTLAPKPPAMVSFQYVTLSQPHTGTKAAG